MELNRGQIERRDFQLTRRGYQPAEVDAHLRALAEAVEQMKASQPAPSSLAGAAASRVEAIVAAAESSAREIEERAKAEAEATRAKAEQDAVARVKGAQDSVERLVDAAHALQREIDDLVSRTASLKAGVDAIQADVESALRAPVAEPIEPEAAPEPEADLEPEPDPQPEPEPDPDPDPEPVAADPKPGPDPEPAPEPVATAKAPEGARLIALNMALSGKPRDETARYLRENFDLDDEDGLLDEVYAKVGS